MTYVHLFEVHESEKGRAELCCPNTGAVIHTGRLRKHIDPNYTSKGIEVFVSPQGVERKILRQGNRAKFV